MDVLARYESLVDDYEAFLAACERPLPQAVRVNGIKASRPADEEDAVERVREAFADEGVEATPADWNPRVLRVDTDEPGNTWPYVHGWVHGQEEVSALPPVVLDPQPGEAVWDAAAAPGSKTTQVADLLDDRGLLVANDSNLGRLSALRSNAERLGVTNVAVTNQDARNFSLNPFEVDAFDRALVDAPCSCEGTIRKNPTVLDDWTQGHVESVAGIQKGILRRAVQATTPGGVVVYATCTFAPEENEAVLDHVLDREDCNVVDYEVGLETSPGITEWDGEQFDERVREAKRVYPHQNDTGGFFCAKLEVGE
ncbi:SAM-dependent methyltransferase [Halobacteriales archaeon QS_1_68_20]|nr:MAG: SAM-dependent methyltransferase [Halobacteriales archaeon QS_1_68_20]